MKRWKYSLEELNCLYEKLVDKAIKKFNKRDYSAALNCIKSAAKFQYHINYIYNDSRLNGLLENISKQFYPVEERYNPDNVVLFFDSFCLDNRGLTQHYLDALVYANKYTIIYVLETPNYNKDSEIINFLKINNVIIKTLPKGSIKDKSDYLYSLVKTYKPKAALFHLLPYSIIPFISLHSFKSIIKYQINLTDHAFWLGSSSFFDYSFEFRDYGITISLEKRGFVKEQLLLNPFYPWQSDMPFQGFPVITEGKVVIFSGGAMYKVEGEDDMYFNLVKLLLDRFPNVILFYAGLGNSSHFRSFIVENNYEDRLILLGNRKDINAVFKNSDIYLSTYPIGGGLMSQYAAINSKPILLYKSNQIENIICTKRKATYKLDTVEEFIAEAEKLITNKSYRLSRGTFFKSLILNQEDFRANFDKFFLKTEFRESKFNNNEIIDYSGFCNGYIERINNNVFGFIEKNLIKNKIFTFKVFINSIYNCICYLYDVRNFIFKKQSN